MKVLILNLLEILLFCKILFVYKDDGFNVVYKFGLYIDVCYLWNNK